MADSLDTESLARLLIEMRDGQRVPLERQAEALAIQKHKFDIVKIQFERAQKLQERTEILHDKSRRLVEGSRRFSSLRLARHRCADCRRVRVPETRRVDRLAVTVRPSDPGWWRSLPEASG